MSVLDLTADIVAAYVENNDASPADLPALIRSVHGALSALGAPIELAPSPAKITAAQARRSITPDALISFEDGKAYKLLKRHLTTVDLTPDTYRAKWGLPANYPMIAPNYAAARSALARETGLGRKAVAPVAAAKGPAPKERLKGKLGLFRKRES